MIQAFQRAIGKDRANEIAREVIVELARNGECWADNASSEGGHEAKKPYPCARLKKEWITMGFWMLEIGFPSPT